MGETLEDFRGIYENERIFLIGNGPSLSDTPLDELSEDYTLAVNRISHIYPDTDWRPTIYYNAVPPRHSADGIGEKRFIEDNIRDGITCFINSEWEEVCGTHKNVHYFDRWWIDSRENPFHDSTIKDIKTAKIGFLQEFWSDEITNFVYHYHIMYGAIQLAVYLGFSKMYFIGCDLGYEYNNPHMICESGLDPFRFDGDRLSYISEAIEQRILPQSLINGVAMLLINRFNDSEILNSLINQKDSSHFTSDYLSGLYISDPTSVEEEILKSHVAAKKICEEKGIEMYNATIGGELEVYERVMFDTLF